MKRNGYNNYKERELFDYDTIFTWILETLTPETLVEALKDEIDMEEFVEIMEEYILDNIEIFSLKMMEE